MANIMPTVSFLSIVFSVFLLSSSVSAQENCSTNAVYIYCLNSDLPTTWSNNNSVEFLSGVGWHMTIILSRRIANNVSFHYGFHCTGSCSYYKLSVVAVGVGSNQTVVWSVPTPVKGNATLRLSRFVLELRNSDGRQLWASSYSPRGNVMGMKLEQDGHLALFHTDGVTFYEFPIRDLASPPSPQPRRETSLAPAPGPYPGGEFEIDYAEGSNGSERDTWIGIFVPSIAGGLAIILVIIFRQRLKRKNVSNRGGRGAEEVRAEEVQEDGATSLANWMVRFVAGTTATLASMFTVIIRLLVKRTGRNRAVEVQEDGESEDDDIEQVVPGMLVRFSYENLRVATEDFRERVGRGGFGTVFKGLLEDGTVVAVKRLDRMGQGKREFLAEVETIGNVHHFNLVRLIGFCAEKSNRLLVYEYMRNGSLDKWIFNRDQRPCLDWQTRKKIILGVAKGLAYLHEECRQTIIHLDIKPQNILLDQNFNAKVSDFGLSKLISRDESQVVTRMRGTPGYLAPEWNQSIITVKADIYSFGIVLLEVVSARRNFDRFRSESSAHLLRLLQEKAKENRLIDIVENLDEDTENHREEIERMIRIGAWCLQDDHTRRPVMSTLVKVLEGVMEVNPNIKYRFIHAMPSPSPTPSVLDNNHVSFPPSASVLYNPR